MSETLKSCPFCGCDRIFERGFRCFECPDCRAEGPPKATRAEAVSAWNTRSEPPADLKAAVEALEPFAEAAAHYRNCQPGLNVGARSPFAGRDDDAPFLQVADFRRAAEVYAALNLSAPGSLALGAVPEGGEERGSSRTDPSAASGRPDTHHSAGGEG